MDGSRSEPRIPLSRPVLSGREVEYVQDALESGWIASSGRYLDAFEQGIASLVGSAHAVGCVNGTAALHVALRLLGVGAADEVIVPTVTFIAPVNAVRYVGAEPVFMDCDGFMNMDPEKLAAFCAEECVRSAAGLVNKRSGRVVKAVIPVHVFGNPCDMAAIRHTADHFSLAVIEDATESLGSSWSSGPLAGRHTGSVSAIGAFSFNGNKIITSGGGGMLTTDDGSLAERARYLISQAKDDHLRYVHDEVGYNFRLGNMSAAVGLAQLEQLPRFLEAKLENRSAYRTGLADIQGVELLEPPPGTMPNHWFYSLIVDEDAFGIGRDELLDRLARDGIETRPLWRLCHLQKPYRSSQTYRIERAPWFGERVLNLPCSSDLTADEVATVIAAIRRHGH